MSCTIRTNVKKEKDIKDKPFGKRAHSQMQNYDKQIDCIFIKVAIKIDWKIKIFQQFKSAKECL